MGIIKDSPGRNSQEIHPYFLIITRLQTTEMGNRRRSSHSLTFSTFQPHARALGDVVGGVAPEAVGGACAQAAVIGAALAAPLRRVVEGLGTGGRALTLVQVALHPKLVCGGAGEVVRFNIAFED